VSVTTTKQLTAVLGVCLLYVFTRVNTPITVLVPAGHDDGLYMAIGRHLAEGRWLGPYDQFTLLKGPGYPLFLAAGHLLGLPVSLSHAIFHCIAVVFFVAACRPLLKSDFWCAVLFVLLLWEPVLYTGSGLRVLRENIYGGQILLFLAAAICALFHDRSLKSRVAYGLIAGLLFGWAWLTREEGIWLIPGLTLLAVYAIWRLPKDSLVAAATATACFAAVNLAYYGMNWIAYGAPIGVEIREKNYTKAVRALQSVNIGTSKPFVSISKEAREKVYRISPSFASLRLHIETNADGLEKISCPAMPASCGEVGSGWFTVALLRYAAERAGHFASPSAASAFFGRLAHEVSAACDRVYPCSPSFVAQLPRTTWDQWASVPHRIATAIWVIVSHNMATLDAAPSSIAGPTAREMLKFLNQPLHTRPHDTLVQELPPTAGMAASRAIRATAANAFPLVEVFLLAICFAATGCAMLRGASLAAPCLWLGLAMWALALSRVAMIAVIDATWMPVLNDMYLSPANFPLIAGAVFFIAWAWLALVPGKRMGVVNKLVPLRSDLVGPGPTSIE
jgi:hypothetical protein